MSLNSPGIQCLHDRKHAREVARRANDVLASSARGIARASALRGIADARIPTPRSRGGSSSGCVRDFGFPTASW